MLETYLAGWKNFAKFSGRATRSEMWTFVLINALITIVIGSIHALWLISTIFSLSALIPSLAINVRRLHDTNRTGWLLVIGLIPIIGSLILFVLFLLEGTWGDNQYGPDPLGRISVADGGFAQSD